MEEFSYEKIGLYAYIVYHERIEIENQIQNTKVMVIIFMKICHNQSQVQKTKGQGHLLRKYVVNVIKMCQIASIKSRLSMFRY